MSFHLNSRNTAKVADEAINNFTRKLQEIVHKPVQAESAAGMYVVNLMSWKPGSVLNPKFDKRFSLLIKGKYKKRNATFTKDTNSGFQAYFWAFVLVCLRPSINDI